MLHNVVLMSWAVKTAFQNFFYIRPIYSWTNMYEREVHLECCNLFIDLFIYSWETTKALAFILMQKRFFFLPLLVMKKKKIFFLYYWVISMASMANFDSFHLHLLFSPCYFSLLISTFSQHWRVSLKVHITL